MEWALAHRQFDLIERSLRAYSTFFDTLGWSQEALDTLGRMIEALDSQSSRSRADQVALAHLLTSRSLFAYRAAQNIEARVMLDRSLEILRSLNEPRVLVEALTFKGIITLIGGDMPGALELFEEGLQVARDINDQWYAALCLTEVVGVNSMMGKAEKAHEQFRSAVAAWRKTGDLRFTAFGLNYLSLGAIAAREYEEARQALEESIAINREVGDRWGLGIAYRGLGLVDQAQRNYEQALVSFHRSLDVFNELGSHWDAARVLSEMGQSTFALGNDSDAEHLWRESLCLSVETNGILTIMEALVGFAGLMIKRGQYKDALRLLLICISHPATIQETKDRAINAVAELEEKLSREEVDSAKVFATEHTYDAVVQKLLG
jgi:tetratricopeptide (TPR) repeat protein